MYSIHLLIMSIFFIMRVCSVWFSFVFIFSLDFLMWCLHQNAVRRPFFLNFATNFFLFQLFCTKTMKRHKRMECEAPKRWSNKQQSRSTLYLETCCKQALFVAQNAIMSLRAAAAAITTVNISITLVTFRSFFVEKKELFCIKWTRESVFFHFLKTMWRLILKKWISWLTWIVKRFEGLFWNGPF